MLARFKPNPVTALAGLGLFIALWPILVAHAAYAISVMEGHVLACNPYWDGCTSISKAGRHGWANHLFRGALLPYTPLLALYWWLNQRWLLALEDPAHRHTVREHPTERRFRLLARQHVVLGLDRQAPEPTRRDLVDRQPRRPHPLGERGDG